jgi:bacillithiol biosynthesis deacetylase BshB1
MKLDILAIGIHPDDVELSCSGTLMKHIQLGKATGILDLSEGELGTRGTVELRRREAAAGAEIIGAVVRENLGMADGFFRNDREHQLLLIRKIREYRPEIILCNAPADRHPDQGRASALVSEACFYSGLRKIETSFGDILQEIWRPKAVYHYMQDRQLKPDLVIDISEFMDRKMKAIQAYSSQFFDPSSSEPSTPISSAQFLEFIKARNANNGRDIQADYAEAFLVERTPGVKNLFDLI